MECYYGNQLSIYTQWQPSNVKLTYFLFYTFILFVHCIVTALCSLRQQQKKPYPAVLLGLPLGAEGVERLAPLGAVGELEKTGESAPVLTGVGEDGILKVDAVGEEVVVVIHPARGDG